MRTVVVDLGHRSYQVVVGPGLLDRVAALIPPTPGAERVALLSDDGVDALYGDRAESALSGRGDVLRLTVPSGEGSKRVEQAGSLLEVLAGHRLRRDDLLVTLGGGMISDLGGFVASVYQRGVMLVHLPTSILGQVDAAVGGKTGVNLAGGKNLVGTFWQPSGVVADTETPKTLPDREFRSGLAEVAKYGFALDPALLGLLEQRSPELAARSPLLLEELVARCVEIKAGIVASDELDLGGRAVLNYGHTLGHALEAVGGYEKWLHGEAISVGMMFAAALAEEEGSLGPAEVERHAAVLEGLGLPVRATFDPEVVLEAMTVDKKYRKGQHWVLLDAIGRATVRSDIDPGAVRRALKRVLE